MSEVRITLADASRLLNTSEYRIRQCWESPHPKMQPPGKIGIHFAISPAELSTIASLLSINLAQQVGEHKPAFDPLTTPPQTEFQALECLCAKVCARLDVLIDLVKGLKQ